MDKKICTKCKIERDITEFHKRKTGKDGINSRCKLCDNINLEKRRYKYDPCREKARLYHKEYQRKNYTKLKADNKYRIRMNSVLTNFLKRIDSKKNTRTEKMLGYTISQFKEKFPIIPQGFEIDHNIPISWFILESPVDIVNALDNLSLKTTSCNRQKSNKYCDKVDYKYYEKIINWISPKYKDKLLYI